MRYLGSGDSAKEEHDACYYEIKKGYDILDGLSMGAEDRLVFRLEKKRDMNVYIYEGDGRRSAKKSIIPGNSQAREWYDYSVDKDSQILVVAYPDEG